MELKDAIRGRRSIRKFKPDIVPRDILESIVTNAVWAPNWGNTQSWEIAVVGPDLVKKITDDFVENVMSGCQMNSDLIMPDKWPPVNKRRYVEVGRSLFAAMGIERSDKEARTNHYLNMYRLFDAPYVIYVYMDKEINPHYGPFDLGALSSNICILAHENGLGTCVLASSCHFPEVVRKHLNLSEDKLIIMGIALGYPDENEPCNSFRSTRDENVISWHGV